jgi:hypothetical protein
MTLYVGLTSPRRPPQSALLIMVASASGAVSAARCRMRLRLLFFGMPETTPKSASRRAR